LTVLASIIGSVAIWGVTLAIYLFVSELVGNFLVIPSIGLTGVPTLPILRMPKLHRPASESASPNWTPISTSQRFWRASLARNDGWQQRWANLVVPPPVRQSGSRAQEREARRQAEEVQGIAGGLIHAVELFAGQTCLAGDLWS